MTTASAKKKRSTKKPSSKKTAKKASKRTAKSSTNKLAYAEKCPKCSAARGKPCTEDGATLATAHAERRTATLDFGEPKPVAECWECGHSECPIYPDCRACARCAATRRPLSSPAAKRPKAPKTDPAKAAAEGPGSSAAAATAAPPKPRVISLSPTRIRRDGGTQMRTGIDESVVEEYAQAYRDRTVLPPLIVFCDGPLEAEGSHPNVARPLHLKWPYTGGDMWLADGFHRLAGAEAAGLAGVDCQVHYGTRRDAVLYAAGANATHGLRRTRADRRRAVETLLRDEEWGRRADRWIAKQCGVSPTTVGTIRSEVSNLDTSETREGQDGKLYPSRPSPTDPVDDASAAGLLLPFEDAGPDELEAAAQRWLDKRARGEVPELERREESHGSEDDRNDRAGGCAETVRGALHDGAGEPEGAPCLRGEGPEVAEGGEAPREGASEVARGGSLRDPGGSHSDPPDPSRIKARTWREVLELPKGRIDPELIIEHHIRLSADLGLSHAERNDLDWARAVGLSQWHTVPREADIMAELCRGLASDSPMVLEPSAGGGALVAAVRRVFPAAHITAHEIDPVLAERLRCAPDSEAATDVHEGDFLSAPIPGRRYDIAIVNSPYEGGADGAFLARCMDSANAIVALLRLNALTGTGRYEAVWSRVSGTDEVREWTLADQLILRSRPSFIGPGEDGAKSDYVIVRLVRTAVHSRFSGARTRVDWL